MCDDCSSNVDCECLCLSFQTGPVANELPVGFVVKDSSVAGAGLGVWTGLGMSVKAGSLFGPYKGVTNHSEKEAHQSGYSWQVI